ncbi:MAG: hypothetical protein ACRCVV_09995 [Shewanella sp.]
MIVQLPMSPLRLVLERVIGAEGQVSNSITVVNHRSDCYLDSKVSNITSEEIVKISKGFTNAGEIDPGEEYKIQLLDITVTRPSKQPTVHLEFKFPRNSGTINTQVVERKDNPVNDLFRSLSRVIDCFFAQGLCEETSGSAERYGMISHTLATFSAFEKHPSY